MLKIVLLITGIVGGHGVWGCFEACTMTFNTDIAAASQNTDPEILSNSTCQAIKNYSICLKNAFSNCNQTSKQLLGNTITTVDINYNSSCHENSSSIVAKAMECTDKADQCFSAFNKTTQLNVVDHATLCGGLNTYTNCTETLMTSPECSPYLNQAVAQLEYTRNQFSRLCSQGPSVMSPEAASCFNRTYTCYETYSTTYNPQNKTTSIESMCSSMETYMTCIENIASDTVCQPFSVQINAGMQQTKNQHAALCRQDGGKTASRCLDEFEKCYTPFNITYAPALEISDYKAICLSISGLVACSRTIEDACVYYLGKALQDVEKIHKSHSFRCAPENRELVKCSALEQCAKDMLTTVFTQASARNSQSPPMCSTTVNQLFPCVENAYSTCGLEAPDVPIRQLSDVSSDYCLNFASNQELRQCRQIANCEMNSNFTIFDHLHIVDGSYWCGFISASVDCIHDVISYNACPSLTQKKDEYFEKINTIQKQVAEVCSGNKKSTDDGTKKGETKDKSPGGVASKMETGVVLLISSVILTIWY